jgi:hypothetical protein
MAFDAAPYLIDGTTVDGEVIRRALGTLLSPAGGIVTPGDLAVTQQATPNMSVLLGTGQIWVPGSSTATQGPYYSRNGAPLTLPISASSPSNPRVDTIIVQVQDAVYAGAAKTMGCPPPILGTPTAGVTVPPTTAAQAATDGAGTVPASSYVVAYVLVPQSAMSIVTADIANVAVLLPSGGAGPWLPLTLGTGVTAATAGFVPAARLEGDTVRLRGQIQNVSGGDLGAGSTLFTVPVATMHPVDNVSFGVIASAGGSSVAMAMSLQISGVAVVSSIGPSFPWLDFISLDGLSYNTLS